MFPFVCMFVFNTAIRKNAERLEIVGCVYF